MWMHYYYSTGDRSSQMRALLRPNNGLMCFKGKVRAVILRGRGLTIGHFSACGRRALILSQLARVEPSKYPAAGLAIARTASDSLPGSMDNGPPARMQRAAHEQLRALGYVGAEVEELVQQALEVQRPHRPRALVFLECARAAPCSCQCSAWFDPRARDSLVLAAHRRCR